MRRRSRLSWIGLRLFGILAPLSIASPALAVKDVQLFNLTNISPVTRVGTYPTGDNAISLSTVACNIGTENVPWLAPMDEDHPFIAYSLYRLKNDRIEQLGRSWVKHTFFVNGASLCGICSDSGGTYLAVNCSDTYSNSANSNQFYLGPREEVDPYTGLWEACGSHFDGVPVDCLRNHGSTGHGPLDHRMVVNDTDLGNADATYFYEAMIIVRDDVNAANNLGTRRCTMTWFGSSWAFSTPAADNPFTPGPAVATRWLTGGANQLVASVADPGTVYLASKATDLGGGNWHYEYALYNYNYTRRIRRFSVPLPSSATPSNIGFRDGDTTPGNDWTPSYDATCEAIVYETDAFDKDPTANALLWGYLFNFSFDAGVAPTTARATLVPYLPGAGQSELSIDAVVPTPAACLVGDVDDNGVLNGFDIQAFVEVLLNPPCDTSRDFCAANVQSGDFAIDAADAVGLAALLVSP